VIAFGMAGRGLALEAGAAGLAYARS